MSAPALQAPAAYRFLAATLDAMGMGVEIWDERDRLVFYNNRVNALQAGFRKPEHIGRTFVSLTRDEMQRNLIIAAIGREDAWLSERLAKRGLRQEPMVQELPGNQWVNIYETRTPDGYLVAASVNVTELMRRGRALEVSNHQLARQSVTDVLTGLANRRRFEEVLVTEWQRAARNSTPIGFLMVDIDHFKRYNDYYGHLAGDGCLRRVADVLGACIRRSGELVARYGGEEFVMLLPGSDLSKACETAQNCLDRIREAAVPHAASPTAPTLTLSIGVACLYPDSARDAITMINAADAAMYRAKSNGRAQYMLADQNDWEIDDDTPRTQAGELM